MLDTAVTADYLVNMHVQLIDDEAPPASEPPWLRTWLLGKGEYAHPVLRWAAMPLFRAAILLLLVNLAAGTKAWSLLWIVNAMLLVISISADLVNVYAMRARRRATNPA
jgi:hypothetical protein